MGRKSRYQQRYYHEAICQAFAQRSVPSDISDHLGMIFYQAIDANAKLIVELGTRGGESTRSLLAAAAVTDATLLSIDIDDCAQVSLPFVERWRFIQEDDVRFGRTGFLEWCESQTLEPKIDLLFVDTSHEYTHTKQEIEVWSPHLSETGMMIFHDTNMGDGIYARLDGSVGFGWNNERGVIRAIEEFVGRQYDENSLFCDVTEQYCLLHFPHCNGLTILKKRPTHAHAKS